MSSRSACVLCDKRLTLKERRPVNRKISKYLRKQFLLDSKTGDFVCGKCSRKAYRPVQNKIKPCSPKVVDLTQAENIQSPPSICLKLQSASKSHAYCFVCKRPGPKLLKVSENERFNVFLNHNIIISAESRCCPKHFVQQNDGKTKLNLNSDILSELKTKDHVYVNRKTVLDLLDKLRSVAKKSLAREACISFDNLNYFSDDDIYNITGLYKSQFIDLLSYIKLDVRNTPVRSCVTSLGIFLMKLKSGISNKLLSTLFGITKASVRRCINSVRQSLIKNFVDLNLGFSHVTREDVINKHTRTLAHSLFADNEDQVILVLDGTYIYIQKSGNFQFQRRSFSMHKGKPLVKPMVIVSTTGYIVSVLGPYFADRKNNDASILNHIMLNNIDEIRSWVKENDIFIVDRGFRDSLDLLQELGINSEMPTFMKKGQKQMTTDEANTSRLVTKVRWVVEAVNSRIKQWKYLDHILPNNQIPYIGDFVKIVCAITNKYSREINTTENSADDTLLAHKMLQLSKQSNTLQQFIEENSLDKGRVKWQTVDESDLCFPKLNECQLRSLTLGTYQLKLCPSYIQEFVELEYMLLLHTDFNNILKAKLQSRHTSSKSYTVWIQFNESEVEAWYCKCKAGARTVGTCAHVASLFWMLGQPDKSHTANWGVRNWGHFLQDATDLPDTLDSSDSEMSSTSDNVEE